ncbi:hypothetical protein HNR46_000766 [Haloferula luteola]|uniref:Ig-like domain-containing protein n=1 Tax=Haloferula luteola TaxID=595692 RepID=A0A840V712_9BACT|nr:DUF3500 domain-containing protein [Haloferula luteola]MBB5350538.1 hypothetical protein [Haloferula luteola]
MTPNPHSPRFHRRCIRFHRFPSALLFASFLGCTGSTLATTTSENTDAVVSAANAFLATLTTTQKTAIDSTSNVTNGGTNSSCLYNSTLANVENWSNIPVAASTRNGLQFSALTTLQLNAALAVADAALSDSGTTLLEEIRLADQYISGEVTNSKGSTSGMWGYEKYYIAFVGTPSTSSAWTLQLGGHHLAYNITYNGSYTSCSPMFFGTEPNSWTYNGSTHAPLGTLRTLITSLRPTLTSSALLSGTYSDVVFGPNGTGSHDTNQPKSYPTSGRGQLYSSLNSTQQGLVIDYITDVIGNHAGPRADELLAIYLSDEALAETYIGYSGSSSTFSTSSSYFRVDGPRLWIEFIVQGGVWDMSGIHDHAIYRDKLGDYGAAYGSTTVSTTLQPPSISTQPASQSASSGDSVTLSVTAASSGTGTSTLSYQWFKDGEAISNALSSTYTISSIDAEDAGDYSVWVISTGGLAESSAATLTVADSPEITTTSPLASGIVGASYSETLTASGGTSPYTWSLASGSLPDGLALSSAGEISGTPTAAGVYEFTSEVTDSLSATASTSFSLEILEPFDVFLSEYSVGDASDDDDNDGVSNLLEFLLGGDPTTADSSILPVGVYESDASSFVATFNITVPTGSVTWESQYSMDLETWTTAEDGTDGVTVDTADPLDGQSAVTVTIPSSEDALFFRIHATAP